MTTIGNPYADPVTGQAPDTQTTLDKATAALNLAKSQLWQKNNQLFSQYGLQNSMPQSVMDQIVAAMQAGNMTDANSMEQNYYSNAAVDPRNQYGILQQQLQNQGGQLANAEHNVTARGLGQFGAGQQSISALRQAQQGQRLQTGSDAFNAFLGGFGDLNSAVGQYGADTGAAKELGAAYKGWADSHYVSEGGDKPNPKPLAPQNTLQTDFGGQITNLLNSLPSDRRSAGSSLGRARDMIAMMSKVGGFSKAQEQSYLKQYMDALAKHGYNFKHSRWNVKL